MSVNNWKTALCTSGSAVILGLGFKMLQSMRKQNDSSINEILFYGADNEEHTKQVGVNNLLCIYYVIMHANRTIDICVSSLNSKTLANCLVAVRQCQNVRIRVALHDSKDLKHLQIFSENDFEVKLITTSEKLEHEFILVDALEEPEDAVAIIGSLDYDTNRVNLNRDSTLLTSEATVVKAFTREFERVWSYRPESQIEETTV